MPFTFKPLSTSYQWYCVASGSVANKSSKCEKRWSENKRSDFEFRIWQKQLRHWTMSKSRCVACCCSKLLYSLVRLLLGSLETSFYDSQQYGSLASLPSWKKCGSRTAYWAQCDGAPSSSTNSVLHASGFIQQLEGGCCKWTGGRFSAHYKLNATMSSTNC